jgi:RNA polymerase sigma-70 factor (ECF subfamily)
MPASAGPSTRARAARSKDGTFARHVGHIIGNAADRRGQSGGEQVRDLVVRARGGDRDAFSELVARSLGRLTAVARMILRDEYAAQDAVQDTCIEAWRSLPGLREPDRFEAWMRRLLVRACFKAIRHGRRTGAMEVRLTPGDEPAVGGVERHLAVHDQLERGLAQIPPDQRAVIVLVYYLDLPLADAAQAMDVPLGTVKSRLSRATNALRAAIEADDREPMRLGERIA